MKKWFTVLTVAQKIPDDAYFCLKCGTKTPVGKAAKAMYPSDELRDAFYKVGVELERAFTLAANETQPAFKKARRKTCSKNPSRPARTVVCPSCGTKNLLERFSATTAAQD